MIFHFKALDIPRTSHKFGFFSEAKFSRKRWQGEYHAKTLERWDRIGEESKERGVKERRRKDENVPKGGSLSVARFPRSTYRHAKRNYGKTLRK